MNSIRKENLRCWAEIDIKALQHNFRFIQCYVGRKVGLIPVVKANAYGHGLSHIVRAIASEKVGFWGVTDLPEALTLKALNLKRQIPILLLSPCLKSEIAEVVHHGFVPVISSFREIEWFEKAVQKQKRKNFPVHVKIDTGMSRLGMWHEEAIDLLECIVRSNYLQLTAVATHFASSDEDIVLTRKQWQRFQQCLIPFREKNKKVNFKVHASNSAAILNHPETHADFVRPGILLYGASPISKFQRYLKPVMQWKARVTFLKEIKAGRTISYGATYRASRKQKIAIVSAGYADGYPRALSNQGKVIINKKRCSILGRVTMDQMIVDVSSLLEVCIGDEVILLGKDILAEELAAATGTISYEIFCGVGGRVPRIIL